MALEKLSEPPQERAQQVIGLLSELSERLRRAEGERDTIKREMLTTRECIQDLNDRNDQTEKAIVAIENRFDGAETQVETALRRLENMEESVDKQSTELLAILRKIEERFDQYDREYKNHAASIVHYGDTLDRFDKKLEKLMQDKARMARKLDALEFDLADAAERVQHPGDGTARRGTGLLRDDMIERSAETSGPEGTSTTTTGADTASASPTEGQAGPAAPVDIAPGGPVPLKKPSVRWDSPKPVAAFGTRRRFVFPMAAAVVFFAGTTFLGVQFLRHPDIVRQTLAPLHLFTSFSMAPARPLAEPEASGAPVSDPGASAPLSPGAAGLPLNPVAETTSDAVRVAGKTLPDKNFFSPAVRSQMDAQIVAARKLEDQDAARLMTLGPTIPLSKRLKRDVTLPRAIQAIEDKAASGNPEAQHDMGALYTSGQSGVTVDYARAGFWFEESARQGVANARYNLGVLAQQGLGRDKDLDIALAWYRAAALLEHPEARYNLGIAYLEGIGVSYNPAMAGGYFEQAARSGVVEAAYNLGMILENGLIDGPRPFEAMFWYALAKEGGSVDGARAFTRLTTDLKIDDKKWKKAFAQMILERPDVKPLADSRTMRGISIGEDAPKVHLQTGPRTTPPPPPTLADAPEATSGITPTPMEGTAPQNGPPRVVSARQNRLAPSAHDVIVTGAMSDPGSEAPNAESPLDDAQTTARIQALLQEEGLYAGALDGAANPVTLNAIRRYQTKYKMRVDGKPTTDLLAHMIARRLSDSIQPAAGVKTSPSPTPALVVTPPTHEVNE